MQAKIACTGTGQDLNVGLPAGLGLRIEAYRDCLGVGAPIGLHVAVNDALRDCRASLQRRLTGHPVWIQCVDVSSCNHTAHRCESPHSLPDNTQDMLQAALAWIAALQVCAFTLEA